MNKFQFQMLVLVIHLRQHLPGSDWIGLDPFDQHRNGPIKRYRLVTNRHLTPQYQRVFFHTFFPC